MRKIFLKFTDRRVKRIVLLTLFLVVGVVSYLIFFKSITVNPLTEHKQMQLLEEVKKQYALSDFVSDGCSGNVSASWNLALKQLSRVFPVIKERYQDVEKIPFEYACIAHDRLYHTGEGGYVARLRADNQLCEEILNYAISNTEEIKARTGLETDEAAIYLYEVIAEMVYRGVRLGGAPCTGMPYAWGYGYNNGVCDVNKAF